MRAGLYSDIGLARSLVLELLDLEDRPSCILLPDDLSYFGAQEAAAARGLKIPQDWKKPQTIFVCSMADMFGEWVPDEWIDQIFTACLAAPQHRYLFLTKNGKRYIELAKKGIMPDTENFWYGCSVTRPDEPFFFSDRYKTFASIEPILEPFDWVPGLNHIELPDWIITGAETGNRKDKARPGKDWLDGIVNGCAEHHIPLFMKESLRALMGEDFRQEFPWK